MAQNRLLATGIIAFAVSMLGCVTPALVALLAALGMSGNMGWLDYILMLGMAVFAAVTGYAIFCPVSTPREKLIRAPHSARREWCYIIEDVRQKLTPL